MYKVVQDYMDKLNELAEDRGNNFFDKCDKELCAGVRAIALEWLNEIFTENGWSEEFVTAFAVYCNFFILQGLHLCLGNDFGLQVVYDTNEMDDEDRQYLELIREGISEQDIVCFFNAISMAIYNFDIPKLYIYVLSFLEICLADEQDFQTDEEKENIYDILLLMEHAKGEITGELQMLAEPQNLSVEQEKIKCADFSMLLPEIIISNPMRKLSLAAISDLETLSNLCDNEIKSFKDILEGLSGVIKKGDDSKVCKYIIFLDEFVKRTLSAEKIGDEYEYYGKITEYRDGAPIYRREFLNLPVNVSEKQYRNLELAKQIKLNVEKDRLIRKNEKMVEDYSHSIENIIKPALIAEVANCLREDEKNRHLYSKIMYIYFNEVITQNECRLLKMVHNVSVSKGAIRENISRAKKKNTRNGISIQKIAYKAINQISLQLAENAQKARFMFILEKMSQAGIDSEQINSKLWDSSREMDALYKMYHDKLNVVIELSRDLADLELNEEELGTSFLYTRIVEVLSNALTYGDYGSGRKFHLKIYTENTEEDENYIVVEMINGIGDRSFSDNRAGNGLKATEVMLERINFENPEKESFVSTDETEDGFFVTKMYIDADLYM
ncbi:MAG: hypothetical protein K2N73_03120 [Lachnospiraceae bacterium]|nr:hypothetical protein [Lachnospiraceae bacterium]